MKGSPPLFFTFHDILVRIAPLTSLFSQDMSDRLRIRVNVYLVYISNTALVVLNCLTYMLFAKRDTLFLVFL